MKNQYFGDITDYRKYGILRALQECGVSIGVCWMMTPDIKGNKDGRITDYGNGADGELHKFLQGCIREDRRDVRELESSGLLPGVKYFSRPMPSFGGRDNYFAVMRECFGDRELIFFDPDNGIEPEKSCSEKHLDLRQIARTWEEGFSALIIQLPNRDGSHDEQIIRAVKQLSGITGKKGAVSLFRFRQKPQVFFFMMVQDHHKEKIGKAQELIKGRWRAHLHMHGLSANRF